MKANQRAAWIRGRFLLALAAAGLAFTGGAWAGGTPANTDIVNKATLNYSVGAVAQPAIASSPTGSSDGTGANTTFKVDNKIAHTVATLQGSAVSVVPGQTNVDLTFTVTNDGNAVQDYALTIADLNDGDTIFSAANQVADNFNVTTASCQILVGAAVQSYIGNLGIDATSPTVTVRCAIPNTRVNNDVSGVRLVATAALAGSNGATAMTATPLATADTPGSVDVVFADTAGTDDGARDGRHSARSAYRVRTASLAVTKTVAVLCDPFNGNANPKNIPGAYARYTITITNNAAAGASALLTTMTDTLDANVEFDPDLIQGTSAANCATGQAPSNALGDGFRLIQTERGFTAAAPKYMTESANNDGATHAGGTVSFNFSQALPAGGGYQMGELKTGETLTLVYQVKIK